MTEPTVIIDQIGGNCPVQAEGTVDGRPFYFRSRGEKWSMSIGGDDPVVAPGWYHEERYGEWPDAGWITLDEAHAFIAQAAQRFASGQPGAIIPHDPDEMKRIMDKVSATLKAAGLGE